MVWLGGLVVLVLHRVFLPIPGQLAITNPGVLVYIISCSYDNKVLSYVDHTVLVDIFQQVEIDKKSIK